MFKWVIIAPKLQKYEYVCKVSVFVITSQISKFK